MIRKPTGSTFCMKIAADGFGRARMEDCFRSTDRPTRRRFGRVKLDLPSRPDRAVQIWALAEDHEGTLWMGTSWGLVRRSRDGRTLAYRRSTCTGNGQRPCTTHRS